MQAFNFLDPHQTIPCELCESTEHRVVGTIDRDGEPLRTVICTGCGLVFSSPRPEPETVRDYYENSYRLDYKRSYQPRMKHVYRAGQVAIERVRRIMPHLPQGARILDFGAGSGEVVFMLRAHGFEASGFEPNAGYADFAASALGLPVKKGRFQEEGFEPESVDVVTAFHVFEHLESPLGAMRSVRKWLKPGGTFIVEVPNVEAVCHWPGSRFHRAHLFNFNLPAILKMGAKAGFIPVSEWVSTDGGNIQAIFRKSDQPPDASGLLPGNFERVSEIITSHTNIRHTLTLHPYRRPLEKLISRVRESIAIRGHNDPRHLLKTVAAAQE